MSRKFVVKKIDYSCCRFHNKCADLYSKFTQVWTESDYDVEVLKYVIEEMSTTLLACGDLEKKDLIKYCATTINLILNKRLDFAKQKEEYQ